jgi:FKBP-type peptidyl-prolyl cis-trans isomerase FkpA
VSAVHTILLGAVAASLALAACGDAAPDDNAGVAPADTISEQPAEFDVRRVHFAPELGIAPDSLIEVEPEVWITEMRTGRGRAAEAGATVMVEYSGWLPDGTLFEQRPSPDGFGLSEFILGDGGAPVPGLDAGMAGMRVGGVRRIVVGPEQGYGLVGRPAGVPAGSPLVFQVRLMDVRD